MEPLTGYKKQFSTPRGNTPWMLLKAYWRSERRYPAYLFCAIVMIMTGSLVALDILFNYWYYYFYYVLQAYDQHGLIRFLVVSVVLGIFYVVIALYRYVISFFFSARLRRWLIEHLASDYIQNEDVGALINYSIDLSMGLISAITTILAFVLWQLSGELTLSFGRMGSVRVPDIIWVSLVYIVVGIYFAGKMTRNFSLPKNKHPNFNLTFVRDKILTWVSMGYDQAYLVLPLLVALPNYCNNVFLLGAMIQSLHAFISMQDSFSLMVGSRDALTKPTQPK